MQEAPSSEKSETTQPAPPEPSSSIINVMIVDDDPFVRSSLATILEAQNDLSVCASGSDGTEAITLFEQHQPDVLLMDIQMPQMNGLEAARALLTQYPQARIVFLTTFSDDEYIVAALRMGAKGYLIKQEVQSIVPAIYSVMNGQSVLGSEILERFDVLIKATDALPAQQDALGPFMAKGLSGRELEIVEHVAEGLDNKEIAAALYMSEGTVRNHISAILQKLQLKNRTQIAVLYYRSLS